MQLQLVVVDGPEAGRVFTFPEADSFLVGRSPKAHLVLDPTADRYISRMHCLIDVRPPRCIVNDLGSTNGTFVNDERVARAEVGDGDVIRVGRTRIRVLVAAHEPAADIGTRQVGTRGDDGPLWEPPAVESWPPPPSAESALSLLPAADEVIPAPGVTAPVSAGDAFVTVCWLCQCDLTTFAKSDGRAAELPDAVYLCADCESSIRKRPIQAPVLPSGYSTIGELGRGGMGVVYKAVHRQTRRVCAVKQMHPDFARDEKTQRLFAREIEIQGRVRHPNLVALLDHGCDQGSCFIVSEFLAGGDAHQLVASVYRGPVPVAVTVRIGLDLLAGLSALHAAGFVHRDLKPANVLLSRLPHEGFGSAKIADYGLAKSFEEAGHSLFDLTREGEAAGSLMFMPPEQILNYRFVRPPADVYAAGVTLYYLLSTAYTVDAPGLGGGAPAAGGRNPVELLIEEAPIPLRKRRPDVPDSLAAAIDTAVQKELSLRFDSAAAFRGALLDAARTEGLA